MHSFKMISVANKPAIEVTHNGEVWIDELTLMVNKH